MSHDFNPDTVFHDCISVKELIEGHTGFRDEIGVIVRQTGTTDRAGYNVFALVPYIQQKFANNCMLNHATIEDAVAEGARAFVEELDTTIAALQKARDFWADRDLSEIDYSPQQATSGDYREHITGGVETETPETDLGDDDSVDMSFLD